MADRLAIWYRTVIGLAALLLAMALLGLPASALPSASGDCKTLRAQRNALEVLGVKKNMARGPAWVKKNLPEPEIYLVRNYITIDEKVRFRCKNPVKKVARTVRKKKKYRKRKKK